MEYIDVIFTKLQKTINNQYTKYSTNKEYDRNYIASMCRLILHFHIIVKF